MNQLVAANNVLLMSSKEIALIVEKRHDNVKRTIDSLYQKSIISCPQIEDGEKSANGVVEMLYMLNKRDSLIVVAQLCPEFTARIVDRWQELEAQQKPAIDLSNPAFLRGMLLDYTERVIELEAKVEEQKPAVQFVERYTEAEGSKGFREVCKLLKANEARFKEFLIETRVMYRLSGRLMPFSNHLDAGRFTIITGVNGENAYTTAKFTPKGVTWIAGEWGKNCVKVAA